MDTPRNRALKNAIDAQKGYLQWNPLCMARIYAYGYWLLPKSATSTPVLTKEVRSSLANTIIQAIEAQRGNTSMNGVVDIRKEIDIIKKQVVAEMPAWFTWLEKLEADPIYPGLKKSLSADALQQLVSESIPQFWKFGIVPSDDPLSAVDTHRSRVDIINDYKQQREALLATWKCDIAKMVSSAAMPRIRLADFSYSGSIDMSMGPDRQSTHWPMFILIGDHRFVGPAK